MIRIYVLKKESLSIRLDKQAFVYGIVEGAAFIAVLLTYFVLDLTKDSKELDM